MKHTGRRSIGLAAAACAAAAAVWAWPPWHDEDEPVRPAAASTGVAPDPRLPALPFEIDGRVPQSQPSMPPAVAAAPPVLQPPAAPLAGPAWNTAVRHFYDALWFRPQTPEVRTLASTIDAALASALNRGEIEADDALLLKADLLDVLEPQAPRRGELLVRWLERHIAAPSRDVPQAQRAREAMVIAAWQAQASEDRDVGELEDRLAEVRQRPAGR